SVPPTCTHQCHPPVPSSATHQCCPASVPRSFCQCHPSVPISATHPCSLSVQYHQCLLSVLPISAANRCCLSCHLISAHQCCLIVQPHQHTSRCTPGAISDHCVPDHQCPPV
ncbi:unnamed protein product, partial [Staurois parvus]